MLGNVATVLGWDEASGHYDEPIAEAVAAYGADAIGDISGRDNLRKLRALARREVWRAVMQAAAAHYDFTTDGQSFKRSQLYTQAEKAFQQAEADCLALGVADSGYSVGRESIIYPMDPYSYYSDEERARP
jgi:hypothetical protein